MTARQQESFYSRGCKFVLRDDDELGGPTHLASDWSLRRPR